LGSGHPEPVEGSPNIDLLFLQHAKELGLQRKTEVSDLIQKQRPLIHGFKQPDLTRLRARKGAFLVPK